MAKIAKPEVMVIELIDRRPSSWVLDGSEETGLPTHLDAPTSKYIKTTSVVKVPNKDGGEGYTLRKLRFIKGCDTIFVDEQEKIGAKPNPAVDKVELEIKHGTKYIIRNGGTIALFDYFKNYEGNLDNPNRPDSAEPIFAEVKSLQNAEEAIDNFDFDVEAKIYLRNLKISDNKKGITYKEKEVDFLCDLFRVPSLSNYAEKFEALINIVSKDPKRFMETIGNKKSSMIGEVMQGIKLGVVKFDATKAMLLNGDKILLTFKTKTDDEQVEELAVFFLTDAGEMLHKQFSIELRAAKERAVAMEK